MWGVHVSVCVGIVCIYCVILTTVVATPLSRCMQKPLFTVEWPGEYQLIIPDSVAYPGIFFGRGSTNSVEDRGQRRRGSGGGSPLVRGS